MKIWFSEFLQNAERDLTKETSEPPNIPMAQPQNPANTSSFRPSQFRWKTHPTFYPTARLAMESPAERYALNERPEAITPIWHDIRK